MKPIEEKIIDFSSMNSVFIRSEIKRSFEDFFWCMGIIGYILNIRKLNNKQNQGEFA